MTEHVVFVVRGIPVPQGSLKPIRSASTGRAIVLPPAKLAEWRQRIALAAGDAMGERPPFAGAISLSLRLAMPGPRGDYGTGRNAERLKPSAPPHHVKRPDLDKLTRAVKDALTGTVYGDDSQVVRLEASKLYADASHAPGRDGGRGVPGVLIEIMVDDGAAP